MGAGGRQATHRLGNLVVRDDQGRNQAHDIVRRRDDEHVLLPSGGREIGRRDVQPKAEHQSFAADFGDHAGKAILQFGEALLEEQAFRRDGVDEPVRQNDIEHGIADRGRERIAAERRAMRPERHALAGLARRQEGAERKPAADPLGDRHDIGFDPAQFIRKELAGPPDAGLDLVEDEQEAMLVAQRP